MSSMKKSQRDKPYYTHSYLSGVKLTKKNNKNTRSRSRNARNSPIEIIMNQGDTDFCVGCSLVKVILYAVVKHMPETFPLNDDDIFMLAKFYTHRYASVNVPDKEISYDWLGLFANELNKNEFKLTRYEYIPDVISMGAVLPRNNSKLPKQGERPRLASMYNKDELFDIGVDIYRLYDILHECAENIKNKNIELELEVVKDPFTEEQLRQYDKGNLDAIPNYENAMLILETNNVSDWHKLSNPPKDGDITFFDLQNPTLDNSLPEEEGHAVFLYRMENYLKKYKMHNIKHFEKRLVIANSYDDVGPLVKSRSGNEVNNLLYYELAKDSLKFIKDIVWIKEIPRSQLGGKKRSRKTQKIRRRKQK